MDSFSSSFSFYLKSISMLKFSFFRVSCEDLLRQNKSLSLFISKVRFLYAISSSRIRLLCVSTCQFSLIFFFCKIISLVCSSSIFDLMLSSFSWNSIKSLQFVIQSFCTRITSFSISPIFFQMLSRQFSSGPLFSSPSPFLESSAQSLLRRSTLSCFLEISKCFCFISVSTV